MITTKLLQIVAGCVGAYDAGGGSYGVQFGNGTERPATAPEITAAQALVDQDAADEASLANLKSQAIAAVTRLQEIQNANSPNNAQVLQAIKDMALIQERVIRVVFRTLT